MAYGKTPRKEFDDSNTLWLRKNPKKEEDWHADYRGDGKIDGSPFWIDGKMVKTKDGETVMRLKVRPKQEARRETYERLQEEVTKTGFDDEMPF
jgi:hypothetical protein